jgi:hypothetical protein
MANSMADSLVVKRLVRNLRYRLTYIRVYESFLAQESHPEMVRLLRALIGAQQSILAPLLDYLQRLGATTEDLPLVRKLLEHASSREGTRSRMRFIHYGLEKAVSWYREQLMDSQMTADPALRQLLLELGEIEAASLWRAQVAMVALGMSLEPTSQPPPAATRAMPARERRRRPRQASVSRQPTWPT